MRPSIAVTACSLLVALLWIVHTAQGQELDPQVKVILDRHCIRCHTADIQESGIRVDNLSDEINDRQLYLLKEMKAQIDGGEMPPEDEPQLSPEDATILFRWMDRVTEAALKRNTLRNGLTRRLTVAQYRNTLRDLLGLQEDLTDVLPPDAVSKDGFTNNAQSMTLSPLQVEAYLQIAADALDRVIVNEEAPPAIQHFRMDFGRKLNQQPCPDALILGANSLLLDNTDFVVTEPQLEKPFQFHPQKMRTHYDFIEGYAGNDTVRGWRSYDSIYHSVFACMRGTPGYPKGEAYEVVESGLLLRPAIPSAEIFGEENTYGPKANFKISLRELPESGNFQVRVRASRYEDGLLLNADDVSAPVDPNTVTIANAKEVASTVVAIQHSDIYQVDVDLTVSDPKEPFRLRLGERWFSGNLLALKPLTPTSDSENPAKYRAAFLLVRLDGRPTQVQWQLGNNQSLSAIHLTPVLQDSPLAYRFTAFEKRTPTLGVYLGLRRDCGSTLTRAGGLRPVTSPQAETFAFEGAIQDFPNPEVEKDNVNYLAGIREIGVRSEFTDGRDMPRLQIHSIEFEGPYYTQWPPETHQRIFIDSPAKQQPEAYARQVIDQFASRAFRRPVTADESSALFRFWQQTYNESHNFQQSIKDTLIVVLTSPQFLFIIEGSSTPAAEDLDEFELASKLAYFLWNTMPDDQLLQLAASGQLRHNLHEQTDRLIDDARFENFATVFASEWLSLDKFDVVAIDTKRFPKMTRDTRTQLRQEPAKFLQYLFQRNLPCRNLVRSDFVVANEVVASYYGLADRTEAGFQFLAIPHGRAELGGLLAQAATMSGLSNGRQSNPVKRGAWLARKIVAEPPDDPPPNVPQLKEEDGTSRSLREKLEAHRNQKGCVKCHEGIDPWGVPLEAFDAAGVYAPQADAEGTQSRLPDGKEVANFAKFREYLAVDREDQIAFSLMKHLAIYATGRTLNYNEIAMLKERSVQLKSSDYPVRDLLHWIVQSDLFLKK